MTGYQSKKKAALDEEGMYLVHQTDHSEDILHMVAQPAQRPKVGLTEDQIKVIEEMALIRQLRQTGA